MATVSENQAWGKRADDSALGSRQLLAELDCVDAPVVRLDERGRITHVNEAWRRLTADICGEGATRNGVGLEQLAACVGADTASVYALSNGVRALLDAEADDCEVVFRCRSPERRRWIRMVARRNTEPEVAVVLTHFDVTTLHLAETRSQIQASVTQAFAARKPFLASCHELALVTCQTQEWDYMGIWVPDAATWRLRCIDTWVRPNCGLDAFERATRVASLGPGVGIPGRVWSNRVGQWTTDRAVDPALVGEGPSGVWTIMSQAARNAGLCSGFAFPLKCDDDVLAVIEVYGRVREEPDSSLLRILEVLGAQIALAELRERAEKRAVEAQLEADLARERLESVLDCAPAIVVAVDRDGVIKFINRVAPGFKKDDLVGTCVLDRVAPDGRERLANALQTVMNGGETPTFDTTVATPDGTVMCFTNYMGPLHSAGQIIGAVLIAQDVTKLRRTEAELFESQRLASIGTLAAGVAHEINTPLQFIGDNLEFLSHATTSLLASVVPTLQQLSRTLEDQTLRADTRDALAAAKLAQDRADLPYINDNVANALELCSDGLQRVTTIVRSLKEFSHPAQLEMVAVDLNRAITATLTVARNEYKYVADLETDFGELPPVMCHVNQINQAVLNIVINASHALADKHRGTEHKGVIRVRTRHEGDSVVIAIRDTAGGIPEHIRPRIFDPFFTTKEVGRGTGQGLAIAWNSIKKVHAGDLMFESVVGEGTEFFVRLPIEGAVSVGQA